MKLVDHEVLEDLFPCAPMSVPKGGRETEPNRTRHGSGRTADVGDDPGSTYGQDLFLESWRVLERG